MKDSNQVEDSEQTKTAGRVRINVGGTIFETTVYTLTRMDNNVLSALVTNRWNRSNQEEIFVDRNPTYFGKVLDYLRDGENFARPTDREARESLRREAEFYNLPGLAKMCSLDLRVENCVQWSESGMKKWWKFMARRKYYGAKTCPISVDCENCEDCGSGVCRCDGSKSLGPNAKAINYDEWISVKHKMKFMKGYVVKIVSCCHGERQNDFCCDVDWDNGWSTHNHLSELRVATP